MTSSPSPDGASGARLYREIFESAVPVALSHDGVRVDWNLRDWASEVSEESQATLESRSCLLDDGLIITLNIRRFRAAPAIEWYIELENTGEHDTGVISQVNAAQLRFPLGESAAPSFYDADGSTAQLCDFFIRRTHITGAMERRLRPQGGRSSSHTMPYFSLEIGPHGYLIAIGWSGQWQARVERPRGKAFIDFEAGMEDARFRLRPGESLLLPRMLILRWEGSVQDGYNAYRRFAFQHIVPRVSGQPVRSPLCLSAWGGDTADAHLRRLRAIANQGLEPDMYWIDAGWYGNLRPNTEDSRSWHSHVGVSDWAPSAHIYPRGMAEIASGAQEAGLGLLLWFEPERSTGSAPCVAEHPDWYLGNPEQGSSVLLNLGCREAREWITGVLKERIREFGLSCLRIDFNVEPLPYWRSGDAPDRRGITELRYIAGLYALWSDLLAAFPGLIIDNCAGGGRRLDYEALRRSIPMFRSDYTCSGPLSEPVGWQLHTYFLSNVVPVNATGITCPEPDTYRYRSALSTGLSVVAPAEMSLEWSAWMRQMTGQARRMTEYMAGDYWPLTGCSSSEQDWMAYQLDLPGESRGMLVAFRRAESMLSAADFELKGIELSASYHIEDIDAGDLGTVDGQALAAGWRFEIAAKRKCRVVFYTRV